MIEDLKPFTCRLLPEELSSLADLALDVRWIWNHSSDRLWRTLDPETWEQTRNPWWMLQSISNERLQQLIGNPESRKELKRRTRSHLDYMNQPGWYRETYPAEALNTVAYFSMEFGLGEAIPLYAGGLGILAGDFLKTASDLNVPIVGVGLLYQQGYFRQILSSDGKQTSANPPNDTICLPVRPVTDAQGGWLRIPLQLPGRVLLLRTWKVQVGRVTLYLLDSNDPANNPTDRSIVYRLYDDEPEFRLVQEMILGIGGWRLLDTLGIHPEVCHLNEGHTSFAVLERARSFMTATGQPFPVALWATRAGNVFTTHTAVAAGFDLFPRDLVEKYFKDYALTLGISLEQLLALGSQSPDGPNHTFNMAVLAMRGSSSANGVSRLHGEVSRQIFQSLFPRWPQLEVPVQHITNGVHMSSWDSQSADQTWSRAGGEGCWCGNLDHLNSAMEQPPDRELWSLRTTARRELVDYVRRRIRRQFGQTAAAEESPAEVRKALNPDILTIGFARRFAAYKRPNLLLHDKERLIRILNNPERPVQLVVGGKAHPKDEEGKRLVQEMVQFSSRAEVRDRVVFLPDYDIELGQELVKGIDLWINTPRRPWEACGTSGMKVLVNGGLNLSELDGWWEEAYQERFGWSIGDGREHEVGWDAVEAEQMYYLLENEIVPEFYERNVDGIPRKWVARIRASMCCLAPQFSSNRMLREYVTRIYHPAADRLRRRTANGGEVAKGLHEWQQKIGNSWTELGFGSLRVDKHADQWQFECEVYLGSLNPEVVQVEIYADPYGTEGNLCQPMGVVGRPETSYSPYQYRLTTPATRPADHYSVRIVPAHSDAVIPVEENHILWR